MLTSVIALGQWGRLPTARGQPCPDAKGASRISVSSACDPLSPHPGLQQAGWEALGLWSWLDARAGPCVWGPGQDEQEERPVVSTPGFKKRRASFC